jgi:tetratricopeptide (TPR) repeat protein
MERVWHHGMAAVAGILALGAIVAGQERQTRLDWDFTVLGLPNAEYGSIYNIFDDRSSLDVAWNFANASADRAVVVPYDFHAKLRVSIARDTKSYPINVEWTRAGHQTQSAHIAIPLGLPVTLAPGESLSVSGVLRNGLPQGEGQYEIVTNISEAAKGLRWADATPWTGQSPPQGSVTIRVLKPRNDADRWQYHLTESTFASLRSDSAAAISHARELLKLRPGAPAGHYHLGNAYFAASRYKEAAAEFEVVLPSLQQRRSPAFQKLAYSYLALGEDQKAEATIRLVQSGDAVTQTLDEMRRNLRRQGVLR